MTKPNWFIGLPVDDAWVEPALAGLPAGLRTFAGEDIHITVAFLGAVGEEAARRAWDALIGAPDGDARPLAAPFEITLGRVLPFGDPKCPSSLSVVPASPEGPAASFIEGQRNRLREAAGLRPDRRPVRPHATIVRIRRRERPELRQAALEWAAAVAPLEVRVRIDEVALYTWTTDRARQLFRIVDRAPLG